MKVAATPDAARRADRARAGIQRARRRPRRRFDRLRDRRPSRGDRLVRGARPAARPEGARPHRPHRRRPQRRITRRSLAASTSSPDSDDEGDAQMATIHREGNLDLLSGKVAVLGYGSQGHAHALNLHDSGVDVEVGLREGSAVARGRRGGRSRRRHAGRGRTRRADRLVPPPRPGAAGGLRARSRRTSHPSAALLFAHGFNVHYGRVAPPEGHDVIMVAPKGPGHIVRRLFDGGLRHARGRRGRAGRERQRASTSRSPTARASAPPARG